MPNHSSPTVDPLAPVAHLLAELLSREVNEALLNLLRAQGVKDVLAGSDPELATSLEKSWSKHDFETHAVEFCRLFVYPAVAPARPEHWLNTQNGERFSIRRWFEEEDLPELAPHLAELPDTHAAKIFAIRAGVGATSEEWVQQYEEEMITPWLKPFAEALQAKSEVPLYRSVGTLLRAFS